MKGMNKDLTVGPSKEFEDLKQIDENKVEFWMARKLMVKLGYSQWRRFEEVIQRAMKACLNSGQYVENHFATAGKMVGCH